MIPVLLRSSNKYNYKLFSKFIQYFLEKSFLMKTYSAIYPIRAVF